MRNKKCITNKEKENTSKKSIGHKETKPLS